MPSKVALFVAVALAIMAVTEAEGAKRVVYLDDASFVAHAHSGDRAGDYYTIQFDIPEELYGAYLEFYVDAIGVEREDTLTVKVPMLEVYALTAPYAGQIDSSKLARDTGTVVNVAPGISRRILIDLTEITRRMISLPGTNYGLIIGVIDRTTDGQFDLRRGSVAIGKAARLVFHYDNRVGGTR
ncbi:MAG: hypothetical protein IH969_10855, partial [Candidatus Krumholzibacteriota bacterium]|nr:hypothetical protein [Candidatus Krumholzibacteriota bacterium]